MVMASWRFACFAFVGIGCTPSAPTPSAEPVSVPASSVRSPVRPPPSSGIAYVDGPCSGQAPCLCRGTVKYGSSALAKVGVTSKKLAEGTPCLIGDFDGNGVMDYAFVDDKFGHGSLAAQVQVLLFDEYGLAATAPLPKRIRTLGLAAVGDGRTALIEPGTTESKYRFVYDNGRFTFQTIRPTPSPPR